MRPRNALFRFASIALATAGIAFVSVVNEAPAQADIEHTVQRGHTLEAISNRYHVAKKLIIDANHLKPGQHLRVGEVLVIPGVGNDRLLGGANARGQGGASGRAGRDGKGATQSYAMRPRTPGVVKITRIALKEDYTVRVADRRGKQPPNAAKEFEKLMRSPSAGATHEIDSRLIALVGIVSNHFGGRKLEVVSGFRPYTTTQYTAHSNHNHGRAIDFRVAGVPNEVVRDFCRTLHNTGCGYYPNSVFVHMDVRDKPAYWIDFSKPGEAPRYNTPGVDADEGAGDIHRENPYENTPPSDAPSQAPGVIPGVIPGATTPTDATQQGAPATQPSSTAPTTAPSQQPPSPQVAPSAPTAPAVQAAPATTQTSPAPQMPERINAPSASPTASAPTPQ